jgi:ERCC4 domain
LTNTLLDAVEYDDSESDGIEIIGVQQSQKSLAIELLSSPVCSKASPIIVTSKPSILSKKTTQLLPERGSSAIIESSSDAEFLSLIPCSAPEKGTHKQKKRVSSVLIESSSDAEFLSLIPCSAPEKGNHKQKKRVSSVLIESSSDSELLSLIPCSAPAKINILSSTTDEFDMSFMRNRSVEPRPGGRPFNFQIPDSDIIPKVSKKNPLKTSGKNNSEIAIEKQLEKQRKAEEKQRILQERETTQAVKSANVLRQKISAAEEIIISFCSEWRKYPSAQAIVESITQSGARVVSANHKIPFTLSFSRKVNRDFDFDASEVWKPCPERIEVEPYTLFYFPAAKLARLIKEKNGLVNNLAKIMNTYPGHSYIFLIEDLIDYYKRRKRLESKWENDRLKSAMGEKPVKRKEDILALLADMPEPKDFENSLVLLQNFGKGKCKIHFSPASETAGWIVSFLQQIAIYPEMQ